MSKDREYAARLFLAWLNERYRREFKPGSFDGDVALAEDEQAGRIALYTAPLFEAGEAWDQRRSALESRLSDARPGSYLLWVPPGGELPEGEPDESEWVRRVVLAASKLASGRVGEARFTRRLLLGKIRNEGGYASVTGGLGRHWTTIATHLEGSFYLDSRALNRFTRDDTEREQLYQDIGLLSQGVVVGDAAEFEHEDAWTVQRIPRGSAGEGLTDGWAITGSPPGFEPADGAVVRRLLRRRLADAATALSVASSAHPEALEGRAQGAVKVLVLIGAYDYMEFENAGPSLRGFDPSLTLPFDVIGLVADGEVKPILLSRGVDFARSESQTT